MMKQQLHESVADFSHCFSEVQHEFEKLIPGIHQTTDGTKLIHVFSMKLFPHISKEIISAYFKYSSLQELITVVTRQEQNILLPPPSQPTVDKHRSKTGFRPSTGSSGGKPLNDVRFTTRLIAVIIKFNYVAGIAYTRFVPKTTNLLSHVNWKIINVFMVDNISVVSVGKWAVRHLTIGPKQKILKPM